jgi:hypothetical protein
MAINMMIADQPADPISAAGGNALPTILAIDMGGGEGEFAGMKPPTAPPAGPQPPAGAPLGELDVQYITHSTPQATSSGQPQCTTEYASTNGERMQQQAPTPLSCHIPPRPSCWPGPVLALPTDTPWTTICFQCL